MTVKELSDRLWVTAGFFMAVLLMMLVIDKALDIVITIDEYYLGHEYIPCSRPQPGAVS